MIIFAFLSARQLLFYFFQRENRPIADVEQFSLQMLISCLIGARAGEVFFYSPGYFLRHPLEAIFPISLSPHFEIVGYKGLSYHGALIGGLIGALLYAYYRIEFNLFPFKLKFVKECKKGQTFMWLLTPLAFGVMMGFFVRIANFINSEIIGTPTHHTYGVLFAKPVIEAIQNSSSAIKSVNIVKNLNKQESHTTGYQPILINCTFNSHGIDETNIKNFLEKKLQNKLRYNSEIKEHVILPDNTIFNYQIIKQKDYIAQIEALAIPRHPVQLYESFSYFITLLLLLVIWLKKPGGLPDGFLAGLAAVICYSFRFFFEFFKDPFNILIPGKHPITMGHVLSLFVVLGGFLIIFFSYWLANSKKRFQLPNLNNK